MVGDVASSAEPVETSGQTEQMKLKTVAHNMSPPPVPSFSIQRPFRTPPSAQPPQKQKAEQWQHTEPIPAEPKRMPSKERPKTPESDDPDTQLDDPQDRIADFDWTDLQHRYHDRMKELNQEEEDAMDEFRRLCQFFAIWSDAGAAREVDRSFKRIKTQTTYVQSEENQLEEKRLHYIKVVDAFRDALALLT